MAELEIDGVTILVVNAAGEYFAIPPSCPHMEEPLKTGVCRGRTLTCIKHLWQWDLSTAEPLGPAEAPLKKYQVRTSDSSIEVFLEKELTYSYEEIE
jgi:toluene monooxygenase system ferredoxin subunit